jgi:hypothetical protein
VRTNSALPHANAAGSDQDASATPSVDSGSRWWKSVCGKSRVSPSARLASKKKKSARNEPW